MVRVTYRVACLSKSQPRSWSVTFRKPAGKSAEETPALITYTQILYRYSSKITCIFHIIKWKDLVACVHNTCYACELYNCA